MAYKFLRGTLLVGSAGATLTGAYTSYNAALSVDTKSEEKPNNKKVEMPSGSEMKPEQEIKEPTSGASEKEAKVPEADKKQENADSGTPAVEPASSPTETQSKENQESSPSAPKKEGKPELIKWIEEEETLKTLTYKISKGNDYKEIKDTDITDSDIEGLKDFLGQEKTKGLGSSVNKEVKLKQSDDKAWSVENETYKAKRLITDKFATDGRQCTFKFKPKGSTDYKSIDELTDEQASGLSTYLNTVLNDNSVCPKLGNGGSRAPSEASNEEKIKHEGGKWEHETEDE